MNSVTKRAVFRVKRSPERQEREKGWIRKLWPWMRNHKKDVYLAFGVAIVGMVIVLLIKPAGLFGRER